MTDSLARLQTHAYLAAFSVAAFVATLVRGDQEITLAAAVVCAVLGATLPLHAGLYQAKHSPIRAIAPGHRHAKKHATARTNSESPRAKRAE